MAVLFDTHAHLDDEQFAGVQESVIERALAVGVQYMIAMGTTADSSRACFDLASRFSSVWAAVGIQPNHAHEATANDWETISQLATHERVLAIGETGLDRYWDYCPFDVQLAWFERHVELSCQLGKPFVVHMRECEDDIIQSLTRWSAGKPLNGIMHSFTGTWETAQAAMDLGLDISFAGMVTYKKSEALREVAARVPLERTLLETDAPYLSPHPKRGHRPNEPALLIHTADCLAKVHRVSYETLAEQTTRNACRRFGLPLPA